MPYLPEGLKSASTGTRFPMRVKSSIDSFTPAVCAMASRCSTELVEPPSAMTVVIAFSNAFRLMMSRGRMPARARATAASPARRQSSFLSSLIAICAELLGRLMPSASIAEAMVLAVYMPPQAPAPGMEQASIVFNPCSSSLPAAYWPTASKTETMSQSLCDSGWMPGRIVPPYTNTEGRFSRAMAMMQPGMFLSQPPMPTNASKPSAPQTVSIESAMTSRETSEYRMPSVPMLMPSETVMVPKMMDLPPAASAPAPASRARPSMCMLQGVSMLQVEAMPTTVF